MTTTEREAIDEANDFLMSTGITSAKFEQVGDKVSGMVAHAAVQNQTEFGSGKVLTWDDGNPRKQLVVTLQIEPENEEDDGLRRLFFKAQMAAALRDAIRKVGEDGIGIGGKLAVQYEGDGEASKPGFNPPKFYKVRYEPPPASQVPVPDDDDMPF